MGIDGGRTDCLWLHTEANRGRDVGHNKCSHRIRGQALGPVDGEHVGMGLRGNDNRGITISNRTNMKLFATDYVIYDKANDNVLSDSYGRVILFGDKSEAELDCRGNEIVIPCTDLPTSWQEEIKKQL